MTDESAPGQPVSALFFPYVVERPVGQGGMGAVYRARDSKLGRTVALKVMLDEEARDPDSVTRFLREAKLAASLEHPGIVRIYEVGTKGDTPYIAMEWIEGTTLRRAKVADPRALLRAIAEILAFAHEHGVVHRDLKPANVMIDTHGKPKLVDFGIAKRVASATFATRDGMVLGTPRYMAPEQELTSAVDARADQYAWGVIAYELLTGELPSRPALAHAALEPRDAAVVLRALAPSPGDRFPSMRDLLAAWQAPVEPPVAPSRRRPSMRAFYISAAVTVALGSAALVVVRPGHRTPPPPAASSVAVVERAPPAPSSSELEPEPEPSPSTAPVASTAPAVRGPRLVTSVDVSVTDMLDVDFEEIRDALRTMTPGLKRCLVGVPYRERDPSFNVRVWLDAGGVAQETSAVRMGGDPTSTWPGEAARGCINRSIQGKKLTTASREGSFLLRFRTK